MTNKCGTDVPNEINAVIVLNDCFCIGPVKNYLHDKI